LDGYSLNTIVRKVHGLHRGEHQLAAGVAHPDYAEPADTTLVDYENVAYPSFPNGEKDCASCHADDRWKTAPSRMACGTCHDNVFFDSGTLNPPRVFVMPAGVTCTDDPSCGAFGYGAVCNQTTHACERRIHPVQTSDATCTVCHPADAPGLSPIAARH